MPHPRVFIDFSVNNALLGRVIFELFNDAAPKTCENFRALCTGEKGISPSGHPLYYKNSIVHRSIKNFMIQAGDFTKRNGSGGESIYNGPFADEDLTQPLDSEGLLCMANKGPDTNGSQFFVTLRDCPHLNGKHVVFGKVIRGYEVIQKLADVPVDAKDRPLEPIVITNCGELELRVKKSKSRKRSQSVSESERQDEHSHSKSKKHRRHKKSEDVDIAETSLDNAPVKETDEEYDARLEREEQERLQAARKEELKRIKEKYEDGLRSKDGVRFKGRGRMKFVDPEISQKQDT